MKLLVLAALVAVVASGRHGLANQNNEGPWQTGKLYSYEVLSSTLARLEEGASTGGAFRARFTVRARAPGRLQARLEQPQHAQIHQDLPNTWALPADLKYQDVDNLNQIFEIYLDGGRVKSLKLPTSVSLQNENLLKGLISALQLDLSAHRIQHSVHDHLDQQTQQGLYRKMETDVTGDCETLYAILPVAAEWRRELPNFSDLKEDPFEVTKSRDYRHCHHRVAYHFGVPHGVQWTGTPEKPQDEQFMKQKMFTRILVGKQGPIYQSETTSTVHVNPHLYGKQKAEVRSKVVLTLVKYEQDNEAEWQVPEGRVIKNLLYAMNSKQVTIQDSSSSESSSSESHEHQHRHLHNHESQQNEDSEGVDNLNRVRRSLRHKKHVTVNKVIIKRSDEDKSWDSDSTSAYVNDDVPNINEPAYAALYMSPLPRVDKKQNPMNAQKLIQEIAQLLQNPNNMPKSDFLSKFNILVRVIAAMSSEQLSQTSRSIEVAKSSNNILKSDMWMIYRDAVAQAGTLPAFQQIKSWIVNKKIQGEEAAQVIASLPATLRYPTKDVMIQFFKLAMSDEVKEQKYLNTTTLIAATRLINHAQVNNETAHKYYPTHMYGRLANKYDNFVLEEILPRLSQELQQAITNNDNHKAQVYIKAIGTLGHRSILDVFAPYLEGKVPVSTYLRAQMVLNLDVLAHERDHFVRAALYSILRNTAEPYEVRVSAILNIFMTRPTVAMMQAMAEMTHKDPSLYVRAALKEGIQSAAELKDPRYLTLARTAQAAKPSLTKDDFGSLNLAKKFGEYFGREESGMMNVMSSVSSEESLFPKTWKYSWKSRAYGYPRMNTIAASFSNYRQFIDLLVRKMTTERQTAPQSAEHKYSAEKIAEMLNIKHDSQKPLLASFFIDFMNQQRYFSLTQEDMDRLPTLLGEFLSNLNKGYDIHYTKVFNQAQVSIMFPLASGMPFIYKYKEPTVVHIQAKSKGQINIPSIRNREYSMKQDNEIQFTYAKNIEGSVGFLNTLDGHFVSAGIVTKHQVNAAAKVQMEAKPGEVKMRLEPLRPEQDTTIAYFSVWPYTANQKKDSLTPLSLDPTTKVIMRRNKVMSVDYKFGQSTGTQFQLQGYSYSNDYRNFGTMMQGQDLLSNIIFALNQRDVAMTHLNFRYIGKQSQTKAIAITVAYDTLYNQKEPEVPIVASEIEDVTPISATRRQEIVKRAVAGIKYARAQIIDLSATFEGPQKAEYMLTAAVGDSKVDPKIRYAFFAARNSAKYGNNQINSVGKLNKPVASALNFVEALQKELKASFEVDFNLGQKNGNIQIKGSAERTKKATEEIQQSPWAKQSVQEIARNNYYQEASRMMIEMAYAPTHVQASVSYKDLSPSVINMTYQAYKALTTYGYWYSDINIMKKSAEGKLDFDAEAFYLDNYLNLNMISRYGHLKMNNVPIPKTSAAALSFYEPVNAYERVLNRLTRQQYLPYCSVDGSKIRTFSNRSYDYTLTSSWHVVVQDNAKYAGQQGVSNEQLVILARRPEEKEQEIYVSYKSDTGNHLEMEVQPAASLNLKEGLKVTTNAKKVSDGDFTMYWDEAIDAPLLYYYNTDGAWMFVIGDDRLRGIYDGQRLVIWASKNRNTIRGVCGYMSGEPRDDYLTQYGIVDKPELYAAAFALNTENADSHTQQLSNQVREQAYKPLYHFTSILRSDDKWRQEMESSDEDRSNIVYRARSFQKQQGPCHMEKQVQYYQTDKEICISTVQVPACEKHCRGLNYQVRPVQVVCRPATDPQFQNYRNQIQRGENPQVSGQQQAAQYRVPSSCQA
ncbi:vitellogenin-like [Cydia splendana]|uniref:vitellogenin-like n=1 Tax=Cydia splendana TaxID=1100963 RepID=UPI0021452DAE